METPVLRLELHSEVFFHLRTQPAKDKIVQLYSTILVSSYSVHIHINIHPILTLKGFCNILK